MAGCAGEDRLPPNHVGGRTLRNLWRKGYDVGMKLRLVMFNESAKIGMEKNT